MPSALLLLHTLGSTTETVKTFVLNNLNYSDLESVDEAFLFKDGCDKVLKLDWRVFTADTNDDVKYQSFSSEHDVLATIIFKEALCQNASEGATDS